jgi:hypothetical protein
VEWIGKGVGLMSIFIPCPVRLYGEEKFEEAKAWVCEAPSKTQEL